MASKKYEDDSMRHVAGSIANRKFYEPMVQENPESSNRDFFGLIKSVPLFGVGLTGAFVWGVIKLRRKKTRPAHYPLDVFILDFRIQVCGIFITSIIAGVFFDVALSKMERKKFQKSLRLREEEEFRLVKEGRDSEIANLPEIYDPHWAFGQKPTYRHRMGKLLGLT